MTSSLVGSEMCIRDRRSRRLARGFLASRGIDHWSTDWVRAWWAQSPLPVSYTHLTLPTICSV
eukprot:10097695-Prorocentrum_lima.AAC.1